MEIKFENEVYDLEIRGLRKLLHEEVERVFYELERDHDEYDEDLQKIHSLISAQDINGLINGFFIDGDIHFMPVNDDELLPDALTLYGYKFEKSNISRSIYAINDNGEEVRIADHKRPAIVDGNGVVVHEHEYKREILINGNVVPGWRLRKNGFSKLAKEEYLLG